MDNKQTIKAAGLTKEFVSNNKIVPVLRGIDLTVNPGEIIAVCGPSGVGKSTLLHLLGLMDGQTAGRLEIMGIDTAELDEKKRAGLRNRHIGFLFQFHYLLPDFTVRENVLLPTMVDNGTTPADKTVVNDRLAELLTGLGVDGLQDRFPDELSGGEQQRIALARALITRPDIILADEPTGNLDKTNTDAVIKLLFESSKTHGESVLIATHNMDITKQAHKTIYLKNGIIDKIGG
jgi:lipoprotein-releasing system ATP-binding protein